MRQDYATLKQQLDKQQIAGDYLIQKAMKSDLRSLFMSKKLIPYGIALNIALVVLCYVQGAYWWAPLALILFGVIFFPGLLWVYKGVRDDEIYSGDILQATEALRKFKKRYIVLEYGICIYFCAFAVFATVHMTSMNICTELMWRRGIMVAILVVAVLAAEYASAKRLLASCDAILERLQMKEEDAQKD